MVWKNKLTLVGIPDNEDIYNILLGYLQEHKIYFARHITIKNMDNKHIDKGLIKYDVVNLHGIELHGLIRGSVEEIKVKVSKYIINNILGYDEYSIFI